VCRRSNIAPLNLRGAGEFTLPVFLALATLAYSAIIIAGLRIHLT
jgi:hypothetical protein